MGKSNNPQPTHSTIGTKSYVHSPPYPRRARSKSAARRDLVPSPQKLCVPATSIPFPPLLTSFVDEEPHDTEEWYDAEEYLAGLPDKDGDVFYEMDDEDKPVLATDPEPEYDGAAKGRIDRKQGMHRSTPSVASPSPCFSSPPPAFNSAFMLGRGPAKPAVNLAPGPITTNPMAEQARKAVTSLPRKPVKKALVVGINYASLDKDKRLYYAVNDARLWRETFVGKGVELENIKIITDDGDMRYAPTFNALLGHIRWLVKDAMDGDSLFFVFSGHAILTQKHGPSILTADKAIFPRQLLEEELVMPIPAGVDLQVVFDCCHSAGMIGLQYCVGRMAKPTPPSDPSAEEPTCPAEHEHELRSTPPRQSTSFAHSPQHGSLYGISTAEDAAPPPLPAPVTPDMVDMDTFGSPPQRPPRGGVVAAPPLTSTAAAGAAGTQPEGAAAGAVRYLGSILGLGSTSAPAPAPSSVQSELPSRPGPRHARQGVVEGLRVPDYFEERKEGFVSPAGKVMVWAGTGESQKAFESYGGVRQGVVTKAMCAALEQISTRRDLWSYLVQEIESENHKRTMRDASKSMSQRPLPSSRIQHAELWVSQAHLTAQPSSTPVLDQPIL
ncbi:hypothetical protein ACGC1H_005066 [Rhizoctonia solani]|uniref:Metacaspase-1 n=1 Tax=Rhizoctonia solani TaxID=456999 RepID=A0A8H2X5S0_9AGAM|nr:unnamed protein product [Rhizoctonia solani]